MSADKQLIQELTMALQDVLTAIDAAEEVGCIDHLDAWEDANEQWDEPIENARELLAKIPKE